MQNIGVFFGGKSPEHDISIITGQMIIAGLKKIGYKVTPVYVSKRSEWLIGKGLDSIKFFTEENSFKGMDKYYLDLKASQEKIVLKHRKILGESITLDLAFPAFHGINGEDGTFQGLFEIFNLPYVGCDVACSAVTMDKILTKLIYNSQNISTTNFIYFTYKEWQSRGGEIEEKIERNLKYPLFIKPSRLGSSIGINKAKSKDELRFAIEVALHYDQRVVVEEAVSNLMDITCAVIGNEEPHASLLQESIFSDELFSYEEKYLRDGGAQLGKAQKNIVIPARIDEETTENIRHLALKIYKLFECSGIARVDFLYDTKDNKIFANEVNTLPGTLYHHLWQASGIEFDELLKKLIEFAKARHEGKKRIKSIFESDILKSLKSQKLQIKK